MFVKSVISTRMSECSRFPTFIPKSCMSGLGRKFLFRDAKRRGWVVFARTVIDYINEYETSSSGQQLAVHCPADSLLLLRLATVKAGHKKTFLVMSGRSQ